MNRYVWILICCAVLISSFACTTPENGGEKRSEGITFPDGGQKQQNEGVHEPEVVLLDKDPHEHSGSDQSQNCVPSECSSPPLGSCLDNKVVQEFVPPGSCHPTQDRCVYKTRERTCPEICEAGRCIKSSQSCAKKSCKTPPAATCLDANTVQTFGATGRCELGKCLYDVRKSKCAYGCKSGRCLAEPCKGIVCQKPPAPQCLNSITLRSYQKTGRCEKGKCSYQSTDQRCPYGCKSNACVVGVGFSALIPFRFLDTRGGSRPGDGSKTCLSIAGKGGVPSNARAVYLNLVAVNPSNSGFLTAYPDGQAVPNVSNLNYAKGETIANGSIVKLGSGGRICIYTRVSTDLIVDVSGYLGVRSDYFPINPARALDTRSGSMIAKKTSRCVKLAGRAGVSSSATSVFVNVTVVNPAELGFLTIYPKGLSRPGTSSLNYVAGQTIANGALVKLGTGGEICVYSESSAHVIVDIAGYFGTQTNFVSKVPQRLLDTRSGSKLGAGKTRCFTVAGVKGIPSNANAVALNLAIVSPDDAGFATAYSDGLSRPITSSINYIKGRAQANNLLVRPGKSGRLCVYSLKSTHLVVDAVGYFSALPSGTSCTSVTCKSPPPSVCTGGNAILSYSSNGRCENGLCVYPLTTKTCQWGCDKAVCKAQPPPPPPPKYTYHPVTSWQSSSQPVSSSARMDLKALRYITIHYPGGTIDVDGKDNVYQDSDFAQLLRNMQSDYTRNRGYSLGYNSAIAPDGDEWEIRGSKYRCAANGCTAVNRPGYAIIVVTPSINASPSSAQVKGVQQAIARVRALAKAAGNNNKLTINGHRDVKPLCGKGGTACPGTPLYNLIKNGTFK